MPRYIVIWRRSPTARYLDVQLADAARDGESGVHRIAVMDGDPSYPLIADENELVSYIQSQETETRAVDADLAHRVLGWAIP